MKLFLATRAKKDYLKLPSVEQRKVAKKLDLLSEQPLIGKKLSGKLNALRCLRSWPYRIIYYVDGHKREIWVDHIIHRQRAYK